MENKLVLVSLVAILAVISVVSASYMVSPQYVEVNGVRTDAGTLGQFAGETIPVKIVFTALVDARDARVRAEANGGFRDIISDTTSRFDIIAGTTYTKYLNLQLPADIDLSEEVQLKLELSVSGDSQELWTADLRLQRNNYVIDTLSVETSNTVKAGGVLGVDVVIKNRGMHDLEDVFVVARISELGISRKVYFSDLTAVDGCSEDSYCVLNDEDSNDAAQGFIYLQIPENAKEGTYTLEVEAFNADTNDVFKKNILVQASADQSDVLVPISSKEITVGEEATFDLVVLNPGNKIRVYEIVPETTGAVVSVSEPLTTVPAGSSKTIKVSVKANEEGTYTFGVNVNSDGKLVEKASFSATAVKGTSKIAGSVTLLTIVLAIVFVVLLVVLIALLARKPAKSEELGESYY